MSGKELKAAEEFRQSFDELERRVEHLSRLLEELNEGIRMDLGKTTLI
ncbi:hypothetical protein Rxycam_02116 [Rubrobacter xylanophilus DSM 9941]|nr:hypothetical protein [Rubrobacter xylanophilus]QYJ16283.1 hypothetical protein Rxycam_02116 [Rubrobacter xylanophilus DSM 9941]